MICFAVIDLLARPTESIGYSPDFEAAIGGVLLLAGLWTPVIGTLTAIREAWIAFSLYHSRLPDAEIRVILAILSFSIAMLGPGAWSVDARLFGRKRFDVDRRRA